MSKPIDLISREELKEELRAKCEAISQNIENGIFKNVMECDEICSCINWLADLRISLPCKEDRTYFDKSDNGQDISGGWFMAKTTCVLSNEVLKITSAVMDSANEACVEISRLFDKTDKQEERNTDEQD